jgi:[ribosomal protein S18]-alanine N-acetyltransferase
MTVLRPMRWWDIESVWSLEQALFADAWSLETFWSELAGVPDTRHYLVAEDEAEGSLVGYAGLFATRHQADVQTIAVAPGSQSGGLGGVLLSALLDEAVRRGCGEVLLEVRVDNAPARALYARSGFEQISVRRGYYQPGGVDGLVLRKRL